MRHPAIHIVPPRGRLGVLLVGLGAVSTTFIAGVHAIRQGMAKPIGSLTQLGTIRLGKRTEQRLDRWVRDAMVGLQFCHQSSECVHVVHAPIACDLAAQSLPFGLGLVGLGQIAKNLAPGRRNRVLRKIVARLKRPFKPPEPRMQKT